MSKMDNIIGYLKKKISSINCFNLSMKRKVVAFPYQGEPSTADQYGPDPDQPPSASGAWGTPPSTSTPTVPAPAPAPSVAPKPSTYVPQTDEEKQFYGMVASFIDNNKRAIGTLPQEAQNMMQWKKEYPSDPMNQLKDWDVSYEDMVLKETDLNVDLDLYKKILSNHIVWKDKFVKIFNQLSYTERGIYAFFVLLEKGRITLQNQLYMQQTSQESEARYQEQLRQQSEELSQKQLAGDTVNLDVDLTEKLALENLSEQQIDYVSKWLGWDLRKLYDQAPEVLADGIKIRFGDPGDSPRVFDQRINFFLRNPKFLKPIFSTDQEMSPALREALQNANLSASEGVSGLEGGTKNSQLIKILKQEKGDLLYSILGDLIDKLDPSVLVWLRPGLAKASEKFKSSTPAGGGDDEGMEQNLMGFTEQDFISSKATPQDLEKASDLISALSRTYLKDKVDKIQEIPRTAILPNLHESMSQYVQAARDIEDPTKMMSEADKSEKLKQMKEMLQSFNLMEKINLISAYAMKQLYDLFTQIGRVSEKKGVFTYQNGEGKIDMDRKTLREIISSMGGQKENLHKPSEYVQKYLENTKQKGVEPFEPYWKDLINYRFVYRAYSDMVRINTEILRLSGEKKSVDQIREVILADSKLIAILTNILGIDPAQIQNGVASPEIVNVINNFIFTSVKQRDDVRGMKHPVEVYESSQLIEEKKKQLAGISDTDKKTKLQNEIKGDEDAEIHNEKANLGLMYIPILYQLANLAGQKNPDRSDTVSTKSLRAFIDLFDNSPKKLRNFIDDGFSHNRFDPKGRTNTELYYLARREDPPPHVQSLIDLRRNADNDLKERRGLSDNLSKKNPAKNQRRAELDARIAWYKKFFELYNSFDIDMSALDKINSDQEFATESVTRQLEIYHKKINSKIASNEEYRKVMKIVPADERAEFENYMIQQWDKKSQLPLRYYQYFGLTTAVKILDRLSETIQSLEKQKIPIQQNIEARKAELFAFLKEHNMNIDLSQFRLNANRCRSIMTKISYLKNISLCLYKTASSDISFVDDVVERCLNSLDTYFLRQS
jgi:hypothetical protein